MFSCPYFSLRLCSIYVKAYFITGQLKVIINIEVRVVKKAFIFVEHLRLLERKRAVFSLSHVTHLRQY